MRRVARQSFSEEKIIDAGLTTVERAVDTVVNANDADFEEYWYEKLQKHLLRLDHDAQKTSEECLRQMLPGIQIRGEETTLARVEDGLSALLDALDGSDLAKHRLGNWCSALTIFDPAKRKIYTTVVGTPNREIYYTRASRSDAAYVRSGGQIFELTMEDRNVNLKDAAIAFYGQKPGKLLSFTSGATTLPRWLSEISIEMREKKNQQDCPRIRIYNLAGIPMMINLVEGYLDAVVEVSGQKCHDVVPGFLVAIRSGAVLRDLSNNIITEEVIASRLLNPSNTFNYVLACNDQLAQELVGLLQPEVVQ